MVVLAGRMASNEHHLAIVLPSSWCIHLQVLLFLLQNSGVRKMVKNTTTWTASVMCEYVDAKLFLHVLTITM
jgi:hypothetical protein